MVGYSSLNILIDLKCVCMMIWHLQVKMSGIIIILNDYHGIFNEMLLNAIKYVGSQYV